MSFFFWEKPLMVRWFFWTPWLAPACHFPTRNFAEEKKHKSCGYQVCFFVLRGEEVEILKTDSPPQFSLPGCCFLDGDVLTDSSPWNGKNALWVFVWHNFFSETTMDGNHDDGIFISRSLKKPCQNAALTRVKNFGFPFGRPTSLRVFRWVLSSHWNKMAFQ